MQPTPPTRNGPLNPGAVTRSEVPHAEHVRGIVVFFPPGGGARSLAGLMVWGLASSLIGLYDHPECPMERRRAHRRQI